MGGGNGAVMDSTLQSVDGFALGEQGMDHAPELLVGQIVAKVDRANKRADRSASFIDRIAFCRASEALGTGERMFENAR